MCLKMKCYLTDNSKSGFPYKYIHAYAAGVGKYQTRESFIPIFNPHYDVFHHMVDI